MKRSIESRVVSYHRRLDADPHHRYRSWGHCYSYFRKAATGRGDFRIEEGALHLAFYLASWGMYRGASFLLWKDFKLHIPVVRKIVSNRYSVLHDLSFDSLSETQPTFPLLLELVGSIKDIYRREVDKVDGRPKAINVTETLVTKILLGTIACTPAYDRFVVAGMRADGVSYSILNERHLLALYEFFRANRATFRRLSAALRENRLRYPPMKLVDMYFWERGRHLLDGQ